MSVKFSFKFSWEYKVNKHDLWSILLNWDAISITFSKLSSKKQFIKKVEDKLDEEFLNPKDLSAKIDDLEKLMLSHANKLEFEEAASLRDKISNLKEKLLLSWK